MCIRDSGQAHGAGAFKIGCGVRRLGKAHDEYSDLLLLCKGSKAVRAVAARDCFQTGV